MVSREMETLIKQRQQQFKNEKSQMKYAVILVISILLLCILLCKKDYTYSVCIGIGAFIGIILRSSRFCFAAAFRDPLLTGNTRVTRGIILALIISTIGFAFIQSQMAQTPNMDYNLIPGEVNPVGIHVMIGAFIFGIGMVLAGGCASGVLMRIGEGHGIHVIVLIGFIIGTLLGAKDYSVWYRTIIKHAKVIYFSDFLDIKIVMVLQVVVLILLYRLLVRYENKRANDL